MTIGGGGGGGDRLRLFFGESLSNRVYILGFFCPKQGQGFKSSAAHLYPNIGQVRNRTQTMVIHSFFLNKNIFYKNIEAEICEILRIF